MQRSSLFVGWGAIIPGREHAAARVLGEAQHYLEGLRAAGIIDLAQTVLLEPHGGELEGFVLITGGSEAIARLRIDPEFTRVIVGVQLVHSKVGVVGAYAGEAIGPLLQLWDEQEKVLL